MSLGVAILDHNEVWPHREFSHRVEIIFGSALLSHRELKLDGA